jgi:hypothetical protein
MHSSMRVSVLSRNLPPASNTVAPGPKRVGSSPASVAPSSSATSFKSLSRSNGMRNSNGSSPVSTRRKVEDWDAQAEKDADDNADVHSLRRDSKLTPALSSVRLPGPSGTISPQPSTVEPEDYDDQSMGGDDDENLRDSGDEKGETSPGSPPGPVLSTVSFHADRTSPLKKTIVRKIVPVAASSTASVRSTYTRNHGSGAGISLHLPPTSSASSIRSSSASIRSHTSTIRKSTTTSPSTRGATPRTSTVSSLASSRPTSNISISTGGDTFRTANSSVGAGTGPRSRTTSSNSTVSNASSTRASLGGSSGRATPTRPGAVGGAGPGARGRKGSTGSTKSGVAAGGPTPSKRPPVPVLDPKKLSSGLAKKPASITPSVKSVVSTAKRKAPAITAVAGGRSTVTRSDNDLVAASDRERRQQQETDARVSPMASEELKVSESMVTAEEGLAASIAVQGMGRATEVAGEHKKTNSTASTASNATLKRKGSSDTITTYMSGGLSGPNNLGANKTPTKKKSTPSTQGAINEDHPLPSLSLTPRGATLEIGIPCIISSKRKRFKAYARYIGEVEGELGPWVGVEVPVGESWGGDRDMDADRQWHDGTWGGIRYFEIGSTAESEWEYSVGDERASRRRRVDLSMSSGSALGGKGLLKREGDQLSVGRVKRFRSISPAVSDASGSESRGLFVRPQQVLYVVDAVGSDL